MDLARVVERQQYCLCRNAIGFISNEDEVILSTSTSWSNTEDWTIDCDTAEEQSFNVEKIRKVCEYTQDN